MPRCYYTCNLLPPGFLARAGFTPRWLSNDLAEACVPARAEALSVHPLTCPYVSKLVTTADRLLGEGASADCLVVPGGCDAARRMGDLLAATYPDRVFVLPVPRSSEAGAVKTLAADLRRLEGWLAAHRSPESACSPEPTDRPGMAPPVDYPAVPRPGGVFVVAGPLTDASLLQLIGQVGGHVSGLESCTSPERWKPLAALDYVTPAAPDEADGARSRPDDSDGPPSSHAPLAAELLNIGMCPRRSTAERREYLRRRLDESRPTSIIYARQSFCDPGAYDALLVARLAEERNLPYLEIEVDFPFDANGPLRTRVEAFLEAQLLEDDLLGDPAGDDLYGGDSGKDG